VSASVEPGTSARVEVFREMSYVRNRWLVKLRRGPLLRTNWSPCVRRFSSRTRLTAALPDATARVWPCAFLAYSVSLPAITLIEQDGSVWLVLNGEFTTSRTALELEGEGHIFSRQRYGSDRTCVEEYGNAGANICGGCF